MSLLEKFITEGSEKADELAKESWTKVLWHKHEQVQSSKREREEVHAALQYAASSHCLLEEWKDCEELEPQPKCKSGKPRKTCNCALCTVDDTCCFHDIRLGPKTSVCEKNVTVVSTVTGCDVTCCAKTLQGFNKHASSRREAVSDSRGVPRCTENFSKIYACSHVSIIRLVQSTIAVSSDSHSHSSPLKQLCSHTQHRSQSVES